MLQRHHCRRINGRRPHRGDGFTLIELIAVMLIVLVMSATAIPAIASLDDTRDAVAARQLRRDLVFARQYAIATGRTTWVVMTPASNTWSVLAEDVSSPGRSGATVLDDLGTGGAYTVTLDDINAGTANLVSVDVDGATEVGFDWLGRPLNDTESALVNPATITLSGSQTLNIVPDTGHITGP